MAIEEKDIEKTRESYKPSGNGPEEEAHKRGYFQALDDLKKNAEAREKSEAGEIEAKEKADEDECAAVTAAHGKEAGDIFESLKSIEKADGEGKCDFSVVIGKNFVCVGGDDYESEYEKEHIKTPKEAFDLFLAKIAEEGNAIDPKGYAIAIIDRGDYDQETIVGRYDHGKISFEGYTFYC
jgi:hypothetical protein